MIAPTFQHTITLYNKYVDRVNNRSVTTWKKTVLKNCYFGVETAKQLNGNTLSLASAFVCRIPENGDYTDNYKGETEKFTLKPDDVIVKGEIFEEISDTQGNRISDLMQKYKGNCFTVRTVSDNTIIPYAPHYRVSGV